jgi:metallo-beta-lactamase class B
MSNRLWVGLALAACITAAFPASTVAGQAQPAQTARPEPSDEEFAASREAQAHVAKAMALARPDLIEEARDMCTATGPRRPSLIRQLAGLPAEPQAVIEPTKLFDNFYYFGFNTVGGWALTTSDGIIIIDALNSAEEAEKVLVPSLQKLGLDPAQIKYVIVQHGHFDHFGGAPYLQEKYGAKVVMATEDWDAIEKLSDRQRRNRPLPRREIEARHGQSLTLGDTTVTMALTPGHTPGSMALFFPVKARGRQHTAMMLSISASDRAALAAMERAVNDFGKKQKAALRLASHLQADHVEWLEQLRKNPNGPNPYLYSEDRFSRYMDIMVECARARVAAVEARTR